MDKKEFIQFSQSVLEPKLCPMFNATHVALKDVEVIVNSVFESLIRVIEMGDEVRFSPVGVFAPSLKRKGNKFVSSEIKFNSFKPTEDRVFNRLRQLPFLKDKIENNVVIRNVGTEKVFDIEGNELFNLSQIARMAGISPPTAHKYAIKYKDEIKVVENDSRQKYPASVAEHFKRIKQRNTTYANFKEEEKQEVDEKQNGFTLVEVSRMSKISVVTLCKYKKKYADVLDNLTVKDGDKVYFTQEFIDKCKEIKNINFNQRQ